MKLYLILLKLFVLSALLIISNYNLALRDADNRQLFYDAYYAWLSETFDKGAYLTGYVVRSEWLPDTNRTPLPRRADTLSFDQR